MLKNALHHQFSHDLLNLYCKVKHKSLENEFLRFAMEESFPQWFRYHRKNILSKIQNQSTYDALEILIDLQGASFGGDPSTASAASLAELMKRFQYSNKSLKTIPIIKIFGSVVDDPAFKDILAPFRENITFISKWFKESEVFGEQEKQRREEERSQVISDLGVIKNIFSTQEYEDTPHVRKPSVSQQRRDMFVYLLNRFSEETASAFENNKMDEAAQKLRSKVLALPLGDGIGLFINLQITSFAQNTAVRSMVDFVWKHPDARWDNYNHDLIEVTLLSQAGQISSDDLQFIKSQHEKNKNVMDLFDDSEEPLKGMDTFDKITIDKKMNPLYIQMLAMFFYYLQYKMKI